MSEKIEEPDYQALQKEWEEEVKINPKVQAFLEPYKQSDIQNLYQKYALNKMLAFKNAKLYRHMNESNKNQWIDIALKHLCIIQQKKLFDAQCKWRAGQEIFDDVEICYDFKIWELDVMNCLFIEQPTSYDVEMYCDYLTQGENVALEYYNANDWQDYKELKEAYAKNEENANLPDWYEFHNSRTGNGILLTLPDLKGKLEKIYLKLANEEENKHKPPTEPYIPPPDADKLFLNYYDKQIQLELARHIENKEMFNIFKEYVEATEYKGTWEYENAERNFKYLSEINEEIIPIESHQDYRVALSRACQKFRCKKIAEHLPLALEHYLTKKKLKQMGIDPYENKVNNDLYIRIRKEIAERILQGRKVNNEPLDFNF